MAKLKSQGRVIFRLKKGDHELAICQRSTLIKMGPKDPWKVWIKMSALDAKKLIAQGWQVIEINGQPYEAERVETNGT